LTLPLEQVAEGERTMNQHRAIKTLLLPKGVRGWKQKVTI
jgi:hypothetical protein